MKKTMMKLLAVALACLLLAGCAQGEAVGIVDAEINEVGELVLHYSDGSRDYLGVVVGQDGQDGADGKDGADGASAAVSNVSAAAAVGLRSSVSIFCTHYQVDRRGNATEYYAAGSGVIYQLDKESGDAFIITNYHVVFDADSRAKNGIAEKITVYLYGSEIQGSEIAATYVGGSQYYDIAVLRIEDSEALRQADVTAVTMADSDAVQVGSTAIAIGNAEGGGISVSSGIVSVDSEYITMNAADGVTSVDYRVMRIDTAVNSGNSGGGLFDGQGRLIGIVNAKTIEEGVENIGYALPSSSVIAVADNIIDYCFGTECESVQRPIMGVTVMTTGSSAVYDPETGAVSIRETVEIHEVTPGQLGAVFQPGDVLVSASLKGTVKEITRQHHIIDLMLTARPGDTVEFQVLRDGQPQTLQLTVTEACLTAY